MVAIFLFIMMMIPVCLIVCFLANEEDKDYPNKKRITLALLSLLFITGAGVFLIVYDLDYVNMDKYFVIQDRMSNIATITNKDDAFKVLEYNRFLDSKLKVKNGFWSFTVPNRINGLKPINVDIVIKKGE